MAFSKPVPAPVSLVESRLSESGSTSSSARSSGDAYIGASAKVIGTLHFKDPAVIHGTVEGEIISESRLEIGESAIVKAKIRGVEIIIKGQVQGDISAQKQISMRRPARVIGNLQTVSISIEDGAVFEGSCSMKKDAA